MSSILETFWYGLITVFTAVLLVGIVTLFYEGLPNIPDRIPSMQTVQPMTQTIVVNAQPTQTSNTGLIVTIVVALFTVILLGLLYLYHMKFHRGMAYNDLRVVPTRTQLNADYAWDLSRLTDQDYHAILDFAEDNNLAITQQDKVIRLIDHTRQGQL